MGLPIVASRSALLSPSSIVAKAAFVALALLAICAFGLGAEDFTTDFVASHGDLVVTRVSYDGNARTRESAIVELTGIAPGAKVSDLDPEAARQALLKSGLFSEAELSAEVEGGGVSVSVKVKEKWTFLPIPSGRFGSNGWSAGLALVEFNLLGLRKTLVATAADSNLGWSGMLAYIDPRFFGTRSSFRAFADYGYSNVVGEYMDGSTYANFLKTKADGGFSIQYPSEGKLQGELDLTARYSDVSDSDATAYGLYRNSVALQAVATINYDGQKVVGYRKAGPKASATYEHSFSIQGMPAFDLGAASAELDSKVFWDGCLELGADGRASSGAFQSLGALSGSGYRTLPYGSSYSPLSASAFAALALPLMKSGWSVMEAGPFYEAGAYATGLSASHVDFFHGPGLLFRIYLRDVDLPAVELAAAYNVPKGTLPISVNVGLSF
jgi:Outer membrane protein/protective antigen OMA87